MAVPVNQFRPVNAFGQLCLSELDRLAEQAARGQRRTVASGIMQEGSYGGLFAPERDREVFAVVGNSTAVAHVFQGTLETLDTHATDTVPTYQLIGPCYIFPLPPTPDPNNGDQIMGRYAGQMIIGGEERALIAYC